MLVVIIDDNDIDVMIARKIISKGFPDMHIQSFSSGEDFKAHFEANLDGVYRRYTKIFMLLDMYLKDMNGIEVAKYLFDRNKELGLQIDSYLLSAAIDGDKITDVKQYPELTGFVSKPLSPINIAEIIDGTYSVSL